MGMTALMLCYYFPPLSGANVLRNSTFVKYLPDFGWRPLVISVRPNPRNALEQSIDPARMSEIGDRTELRQCGSIEFSSLYHFMHRVRLRRILFELERYTPLMHMDYKIGWYPAALQEARRAITSEPISVIYSTSTPFSSHLVASRLQREFGLPWVADFQDPWTRPCQTSHGTALKWKRPYARLDAKLERMVVTQADAVIANTPLNKRALLQKYGLPEERVHVIQNGFDPAHFHNHGPGRDDSRFVITCAGWFYETADPGFFFRAYRRLTDTYPNTLLRLVGRYSRAVGDAAHKTLRPETWESLPRLEHNKAIAIMQESTVLLANLPEGTDWWIPSKIFEYFAARRPVLLVGPPGNAADVVRSTRGGIVVGFDEEELFAALQYLHLQWRRGFPDWNPSANEIAKYDRRNLTQQLCAIFDSLTWPVAATSEIRNLRYASSRNVNGQF
jgi:glycosyltransferase involved in cell wall biosynthesis